MPVIAVANPKGGVGKSTLSTQVAGCFASQGHTVMLGDIDHQQSSLIWLGLRPASLPPIRAWEVRHDAVVRPPKGTTYVVLDTSAGLNGKRLDDVLKLAAKILVPLQPSIFDIHATHDFLHDLIARKPGGKVRVGVVGMRMRENTLSADQLKHFLGTLDVPVVGYLRDTQNYIQLAAHGLSLWDVAPSRAQRDLEQWQPIVEWLSQ